MIPYYIKKEDFSKVSKQRQVFQSVLLVLLSGLPLYYWSIIPKVVSMYADFGANLPSYYEFLKWTLPLFSVILLVLAVKIYVAKPLEQKEIKSKLAKFKKNEMVNYRDIISWKQEIGFVITAFFVVLLVVMGMLGVVVPIYNLSV